MTHLIGTGDSAALSAATPAEIDTALAGLYLAERATEKKVNAAADDLHHVLGEQPRRVTRTRKLWPTTTEEALSACRARGEEQILRYAGHHTFAGRAERYEAAVAELQAVRGQQEPYHQEYVRRGRWSRFFTVQQHNGHIHSSMACSTCNRGASMTEFGWNPELSGLSEADAVAKLGPSLCTVCFPSAPVEWTVGAAATAHGHCDGSALRPIEGTVRRTGMNRYGDCQKCNARPTVNQDGTLRKHKADGARETPAPAVVETPAVAPAAAVVETPAVAPAAAVVETPAAVETSTTGREQDASTTVEDADHTLPLIDAHHEQAAAEDATRPAPAPAPAKDRPVVLVATPDGTPKRAEIWEDKPGTTVQVVYCDTRRSAHIARKRILGPAPAEQATPVVVADDPALTAAAACPIWGSLRQFGDPRNGIYFGADSGRPTRKGRRVCLKRGSNAVQIIDADTSEIIAHYGQSKKFWLAPPTDPATPATPDDAYQAQITAWLDRHNLTVRDGSHSDGERILRDYHAAMAADRADAEAEQAARAAAPTPSPQPEQQDADNTTTVLDGIAAATEDDMPRIVDAFYVNGYHVRIIEPCWGSEDGVRRGYLWHAVTGNFTLEPTRRGLVDDTRWTPGRAVGVAPVSYSSISPDKAAAQARRLLTQRPVGPDVPAVATVDDAHAERVLEGAEHIPTGRAEN